MNKTEITRITTRKHIMFFLFQTNFREEPYASYLGLYREMNPELESDIDYFLKVVNGIASDRKAVDSKFEKFLRNWEVDRLPVVDRVILEIAVYEIENCEDVPVSVSINEAVRLAKEFAGDGASSYINGVLSSFEKSL
ncbi:MAG: transcription antitermination factor NusB [Clostridiales bacterium]|nr:transcription antitermination factor NusB [Clostridiales bacterium]